MNQSVCLLALILILGSFFAPCVTADGNEAFENTKRHQGMVPLHGNEAEQYEHYLNLTAGVNNKDTWKLWTDCINEISRNGGSNDACTNQCKEKMRERMKDEHLHDERIRSGKKVKPDCNYDIVIGDSRIEGMSNATQTMYNLHVPVGAPFITFTIATGACKSDEYLQGLQHAGGANFGITLASHYDLVSCVTEDRFHGMYLVACPMHPLDKAHARAATSTMLSHKHHGNGGGSGKLARHLQEASPTAGGHLFTLTVTLDFEHFDAFSDVFAPDRLLDALLFRGTLQIHKTSSSSSSSGGGSSSSQVMGNLAREVADQERGHSVYGHWTLDKHSTSSSLSHGALADFHWQGTGDAFVTSRKAFQAIFGGGDGGGSGKSKSDAQYASTTTHLIGASHMRYNWDFFYYLYYGAKKLGQFDRRHGYSNHMPRLVLESVLFATDLGDYFANQKCPAKGTKAVYCFQFGTHCVQCSSLPFLFVMSLYLFYPSIDACLYFSDITPHDTSLTIVPPSINHQSTQYSHHLLLPRRHVGPHTRIAAQPAIEQRSCGALGGRCKAIRQEVRCCQRRQRRRGLRQCAPGVGYLTALPEVPGHRMQTATPFQQSLRHWSCDANNQTPD